MTRCSSLISILLFTAVCGGEASGPGGAKGSGAASTKDNKGAGAGAPATATAEGFDGCLKGCDASNESATDKATCRLNCDAAFGSERKNAVLGDDPPK